jgi:CheY-like chemotaxis protein
VESEPGRGATFSIYLPDATPTSVEQEPDTPSPRSLRGSETVLLVEDDPAVRALARQVLLRYGYQVLEAPVPSQAILIAKRHAGPIDLLLTDVVMPEMPGPEVARRLQEIRPEIRVLYMSGYAEESMIGDGVIGRGSNFLQKPFGPATLAEKLRDMLDGDTSGVRRPATSSAAADASSGKRVAT